MIKAMWITTAEDMGDVCPIFRKKWTLKKTAENVELILTALGVYEAKINGKRISDYVLAPGWTSYEHRLQYQEYNITDMVGEQENILTVTVGKGWYRSRMADWADKKEAVRRQKHPCGLIAELHITYTDGEKEVLLSDKSWEYGESPVRFSEIYDGESYNACFRTVNWKKAVLLCHNKEILIPQEGPIIREKERIKAKSVIQTPKGEVVIDFGQEIAGYVEFTVDAEPGDEVHILHGEVLDSEGNFYRDNYRSAKAEIKYICRKGKQTWHPGFTFFGFRYIKLDVFPGDIQDVNVDQFTAIVVHSDLKRTGEIACSDPQLNRLISNVFWGQKSNFIDVPTDCPQRDECLGWTGDAQVFVKTAAYNYDVEVFFRKWLHDLAVDQRPDGGVSCVVPDYMPKSRPSAGWGDAAVICPWQIYMTYGNSDILADQFDSMKNWVDYITASTKNPGLWTGGEHYGDWLGLDAPEGSYKGSSREELIASAYYAYSTELLIKAGRVLGKDMDGYARLHKDIIKAFRRTFPQYHTQTECVLAVRFGLTEDAQKTVDDLAEMIRKDGNQMRTGFIGTPMILHVLSSYGYTDLAYSLLLRREYPSWLYSVEKGATTIWEHWDGIRADGNLWSADMNSFNHYSYGAVADWIYEVAAGISPIEDAPGFQCVRIEPHPDERLGWLKASIQTRNGLVSSGWTCEEGRMRYDITVEMPTRIVIDGKTENVGPGKYTFWGSIQNYAHMEKERNRK